MLKKSNIHQWFSAAIAILLITMPVLLADELSLLANWFLAFACWFAIIAISFIKAPKTHHSKPKPQG